MAGYSKGHHKAPTMNDMPVPQGDFFELYNARQRKHRAVFFIGLAMFSSAIFAVKFNDKLQEKQ